MARQVFKGFKQVTSSFSQFEDGYLYLVRTSEDLTDGYIYFNGKKYGTAADADSELKELIGTLPSGETDVVSYIAKVNSALSIEASARQTMDNSIMGDSSASTVDGATVYDVRRAVDAISGDSHTHTNKDVLDGITAEQVSDWDGTLASAQSYTDAAVEALDATVSGESNGVSVTIVEANGVLSSVTVVAPEVASQEAFEDLSGNVETLESNLATETSARTAADEALEAEIDAVEGSVTAETAAREAADDVLSGRVDAVEGSVTAETAAREAADNALSGRVDAVETALTAETSARTAADEALDARLDALEAVSAETRISELEDSAHTHENKSVLDGITAEKVANWDALVSGSEVTLSAYTEGSGATEGYLKTYELFQGGSSLGKIDIPKDLVVTSGQVVEVSGEKYLRLTIANQAEPVDIAVADLAHVYTEGNGIEISNTDVISAKVVEANGLSVDASGISMSLADGSNNGAMSAADFTKLGTIEASAQTNVIEVVKVDGTALTVDTTDKSVNIELPNYDNTYAPLALTGTVETNRTDFDNYTAATDAAISAETAAREAADDALSGRIDTVVSSVTAETAAREAADDALSGRIDTVVSSVTAETAAREAADDVLSGRVDAVETALTAEASARTAADEALDARLDALEALTGSTSSALQSVSEGDASISVGTKDSNNDQTIAVNISEDNDNALELKNDGLFAAIYYEDDDPVTP